MHGCALVSGFLADLLFQSLGHTGCTSTMQFEAFYVREVVAFDGNVHVHVAGLLCRCFDLGAFKFDLGAFKLTEVAALTE